MPRLTCKHCKKEKAVSKFPKRGGPTYENLAPSDPRRYDSQCKLCKKYAKPGQDRKTLKEPVRRYTTPVKPKKKNEKVSKKEYRARVRAETRIKSMLYLAEKGCEDCDERDPRKLEYDHKNPSNKKHHVARLITEGYSWSSPVLRAEIRKCRVLCANCHRKHTIVSQGYYADGEVVATLDGIATKYGFDV